VNFHLPKGKSIGKEVTRSLKILFATAAVFFLLSSRKSAEGIPAAIPLYPFKKIVLPFSITNKKNIVVQGEIRGIPVHLIIDTGMDAPLILSRSFCSEVGLPLKKDANPDQNYSAVLHLFGRKQEETGHVLKSFSLRLNRENFRMRKSLEVSDFSYFTHHPDKYQGIIGWGFFHDFFVKFDFPNREIILEHADSTPPSFQNGIHISDGFIPIISVRILNKSIPFLLDTGSPQSWISYKSLNKLVKIPIFASVPGNLKGTIKVDSLQVGRIHVHGLSINVIGGFFAQSQNKNFQGILGLNALKTTAVMLDPTHKIALIKEKY
jgi:hypothetical protein